MSANAQSEAPRKDSTGRAEWSVSGEQRTRYERLDRQFRPALDPSDRVLALRTRVRVAARWPQWGFDAELMDSRALLNDSGSTVNGSIVNTLEPIQLMASRSWSMAREGSQSVLRVGRMTFDLGTRRLIARNAYRNTVNSFLGTEWSWQGTQERGARVFYLVPMRTLPTSRAALLDNDPELDRSAGDTRILGLHYHFPILSGEHRLELYWLDFDADASRDRREFVTVGVRFYRPSASGRWHYELEAIGQSGDSSATVDGEWRDGLDHSASLYHVDLGYSFALPWAPIVTVRYDRASGDDDPSDMRNERFDTLFGARRFDFGPTGIYGPFARANIEALGVRAALRPARRWRAMLEYRAFELASSRDAWTTAELRDQSGAAGDQLGRQLEVSINWSAIAGRLELETGAAYFRKGSFIDLTAPEVAQDSRYHYVSITTSF